MLTKKERVLSLLDAGLQEMILLKEMSKDILQPDDFISSTTGMIVFRACGMSLQYITESFVKIRNLCGREFFNPYKFIPWDSVFGMRNFLSHEYGDVDTEGIFNTVKTNIPELLLVTEVIHQDLTGGKLDTVLLLTTPHKTPC
ncbi:MAG: DUF86 domain-containing protein [Bacteroidales bacterium]|nr:DUF86 domain-containing protein [Bacteroidales bacterium]